MRLKFSVLALISALALTACGGDKSTDGKSNTKVEATTPADKSVEDTSKSADANGEVVIKTADGDKAIKVNASPIAVYDMTVLQNLTAIGVVPDGFPATLPKIEGLSGKTPNVDIGTVFEPNLENLNGMKAQAVFIGSRMVEKKAELEKIAPVYNLTVDTNDAYVATKQQLTDFGQAFGKTAEAQKAIADVDKAIADAKAAMEGKGSGLAILINGGKMSAYSKNSRYGFLHTAFGIPMADDKIEDARHGQPITFEYLQKTDPDWLFVLDRSAAIGQEGASAQSVLDNPLIHNTKAWKNKQIVYLSPDSYLAFGGYYQWIKDSKIIIDAVNGSKK